jgi:hypothetical protein
MCHPRSQRVRPAPPSVRRPELGGHGTHTTHPQSSKHSARLHVYKGKDSAARICAHLWRILYILSRSSGMALVPLLMSWTSCLRVQTGQTKQGGGGDLSTAFWMQDCGDREPVGFE